MQAWRTFYITFTEQYYSQESKTTAVFLRGVFLRRNSRTLGFEARALPGRVVAIDVLVSRRWSWTRELDAVDGSWRERGRSCTSYYDPFNTQASSWTVPTLSAVTVRRVNHISSSPSTKSQLPYRDSPVPLAFPDCKQGARTGETRHWSQFSYPGVLPDLNPRFDFSATMSVRQACNGLAYQKERNSLRIGEGRMSEWSI